MLLATALLIIGLLLVVYSADRLVYAASILCRMLGIPPLIIGMTVVSIGTSLPEIMVATAASLHGQTDLAVGTALGSNITNILLILGLAALLRPFTVHSDILRRELPLMLLVSVLAGLVLYDGQLTRLDGLFLLALALLWLLFTIKIARLAERQGSDSLTREQLAELPREGSLPVALLWLGVAMIVMPMATRMVVDNSTVLANYFAISELTVGLTVVAIGTSLPELATAIAQQGLEAALDQPLTRIMEQVQLALDSSQTTPDVIYLTGGSARSPLIKKALTAQLPGIPLAGGDDFGSVTAGLARWAQVVFR
ncbi:calcium/sodium antiporter [Klebsiella pneumoniae]|nr:calcium/sodium antiporter [Klebsiella pneumoniae]